MESIITVWVFIPIYNFEPFLKECFESLYIQTYKNYHCFIVVVVVPSGIVFFTLPSGYSLTLVPSG